MSPNGDQAEDAAIAHFIRRGSTLTASPSGKVTSLFLSIPISTDSTCLPLGSVDLLHLAALRDLRKLYLSLGQADDAIWPAICRLRKLNTLELGRSGITDEGLKNLKYLPELKSLNLSGTQTGDQGLAHICDSCPKLTKLSLINTRITSRGTSHLSHLKSLRELDLVQTRVGDKGLKPLEDLRSLTELGLESTSISNSGLKHLSSLTSLKGLTIHDTAITERGLIHLERLSKLNTFYLCVRVSAIGLKSLKKLRSLQNLYIGDVMSREERDALQEQLPGICVE